MAEESLLGAMLLSRDAINEAIGIVTADDFYKPAHGVIYEAVVDLHSVGEPVDPVTVADQLRRRDMLETIGGPATLISLQANTPATTSAGRYAAIVTEMATLRRLIGVAGEVAELAYATPEDVAAAVDRAEQMIYEVSQSRRRRREATDMIANLEGWLDRLSDLFENGAPPGIQTGLIDLDEILGGLRPGQLITIAGRPAMGKSLVGAQIASYAASCGHPTLVVSAEMSTDEITTRLVAAEARVDLQHIRTAKLAASDWPRLSIAIDNLKPAPLLIDDDSAATVTSIAATARRIKARRGLELIVVDYLQLLTAVNTSKGRENRQVEVSDICAGLKRIARQIEVPVIALAQLNRQVENRSDKRPTLADLRESGAIEQDSDIVIGLYRDEYYNPQSDDIGVAELSVLKQRNGPTGLVKVAYLEKFGRFANMARM